MVGAPFDGRVVGLKISAGAFAVGVILGGLRIGGGDFFIPRYDSLMGLLIGTGSWYRDGGMAFNRRQAQLVCWLANGTCAFYDDRSRPAPRHRTRRHLGSVRRHRARGG